MSQERNNPIKQEKMRKRLELLSRGVDPYPHNWSKKRTHIVQLIPLFESGESEKQIASEKSDQPSESEKSEKKLFHIAGRLMRRRPMGKAAFFNIQDEEGELQCYIRRDDFPKSPEELPSTDQSDNQNFKNSK